MKHEKWLSCLTGAGLAFALALAGAGCLVTAFYLQPVSLAAVAIIYGAWALLCAVCFTVRHGVLGLAAGGALLMGCLLREGRTILQIEALIHKISRFYDAAYGVGVVSWSGKDLSEVPVNGALLLIGGIVILLTVWAVCRRKTAFFAVGIGFLPLAACFVVTDTIPDPLYVWLMAASMVLLLLPQAVRKKDSREGLRLTALLLIPVLLASMLLFWCNPRETYWDRLEQVRSKVINWVDALPFVEITPDGNLSIGSDSSGPKEDLRNVGPKALRRTPVMDVIVPKTDFIYLRGQSLDVYSGVGWDASPVSTGEDPYFPSKNMESIGLVTISTRMYHVRRYVPYYADKYILKNGEVENKGDSQEYHYRMLKPVSGGIFTETGSILGQCLKLPDSTRKAAEDILDQVFAGVGRPQGVRQVAQALQNYVQDSARYSLDTPRMPAEETDFAIWFLRRSETGYCVHFATALAVLLRAADIPARYVTGYAFEARGGMKTIVRASDAHAWVEYMDPHTGWTVLDATPEDWTQQDAQTTTPTEVTEPVVTGPTEPTGETVPTETTQPDTEPEETTQATTPNSGAEPGGEQKTNSRWLLTAEVLLWIIGGLTVMIGQYGIRRAVKLRKMRKGHRNRRAMAMWQETKRMARLTGQKLPEDLRALAEKAKFSQHTLTAAELLEFKLWLENANNKLNEKPWITRVIIRLVWAVA